MNEANAPANVCCPADMEKIYESMKRFAEKHKVNIVHETGNRTTERALIDSIRANTTMIFAAHNNTKDDSFALKKINLALSKTRKGNQQNYSFGNFSAGICEMDPVPIWKARDGFFLGQISGQYTIRFSDALPPGALNTVTRLFRHARGLPKLHFSQIEFLKAL